MTEKISAALKSAEDRSGNRDNIYLETSTDEIITHADTDDDIEPISFTDEIIKLQQEDNVVVVETNSTRTNSIRAINTESNKRASADNNLKAAISRTLNTTENIKNTSDDLFVVGEETPTGNKYKKMWMKPAELAESDRPHQPWEDGGEYVKDPSLPNYTLSGGPTVGPTGVETPQPPLDPDEEG